MSERKQSIEYIVNPDHAEMRLDKYLTARLEITRSQVLNNIKQGLIYVNDKITKKAGYSLESGDRVSGIIVLLPEADEDLEPEDIEIDIVYEDEWLIVINKPANLIVHPTRYLREGTLVNALLHKYKEDELSDLDGLRPGIVHRLDKDTTGLMIIAKDNQTHAKLSEMLAKRDIKRIYYALVLGHMAEESGTIEAYLGRHPKDRKKIAVRPQSDKNVKNAITHWQVKEEYNLPKKVTLLEVSLETGRTHQIRVHMAHISRPIIGDPLYGHKLTQHKLINRQCLHAGKLQFIHPHTSESLSFEAFLPEDFQAILNEFDS